jgi:hypothetical protein
LENQRHLVLEERSPKPAGHKTNYKERVVVVARGPKDGWPSRQNLVYRPYTEAPFAPTNSTRKDVTGVDVLFDARTTNNNHSSRFSVCTKYVRICP